MPLILLGLGLGGLLAMSHKRSASRVVGEQKFLVGSARAAGSANQNLSPLSRIMSASGLAVVTPSGELRCVRPIDPDWVAALGYHLQIALTARQLGRN